MAKNREKIILLVVSALTIIGAGIFLFWPKGNQSTEGPDEAFFEVNEEALNEPKKDNEKEEAAVEEAQPEVVKPIDKKEEVAEVVIPERKVLEVPFTSQAPFSNWAMPYQEACEEASMLMVGRYFSGQTRVIDKGDADKAIYELLNWEAANGYAIDMTAEETTEVLRKFYNLSARTIYDYDVETIKKEVTLGNPVIIPAAGRQLGNPNFTPPGPLYHMLVIKGFDSKGFITNDPGTRNGRDYWYTDDRIMSSIHDWNGGNVGSGQKVIISVSK